MRTFKMSLFTKKNDLGAVHSDDDERISFKASDLQKLAQESDPDKRVMGSLGAFKRQQQEIEMARKKYE